MPFVSVCSDCCSDKIVDKYPVPEYGAARKRLACEEGCCMKGYRPAPKAPGGHNGENADFTEKGGEALAALIYVTKFRKTIFYI